MYYKYIISSAYLKIKINVNLKYFEMKKKFINKKYFQKIVKLNTNFPLDIFFDCFC